MLFRYGVLKVYLRSQTILIIAIGQEFVTIYIHSGNDIQFLLLRLGAQRKPSDLYRSKHKYPTSRDFAQRNTYMQKC